MLPLISLARRHVLSCLPLCIASLATALPLGPTPGSGQLLLTTSGEWQVSFEPKSARLECRHLRTGTRLAGPLAFTAIIGGQPKTWSLQLARDFAPQRLAIVDDKNDVQGYVTIGADGTRLWLLPLHRPPQLYAGELTYAPAGEFGASAFACRTRVPETSAVAQMASGPADSLLNDSLFDPEQDRVLRFAGHSVVLTTQPARNTSPPSFQARLTASIQAAEDPAITLELIPSYYRSRYVPNYRLIDRRHHPAPPTGWMSWNVYFDQAGEQENLAEARVGARCLQPFGLQIWSIESWQDNSPKLPVSNFYNLTLRPSATKFPHGMKWLAGQIRALGFQPGIWTVPWGTGDATFYQAHRDWFLHDPDGKPLANWNGRFVLDPSQPKVRRHMEETHRTMARDWGYEFFKIDGMSGRGPGYSAHFFERPEVRAAFRYPVHDPYSLCLQALRRGIGPDRTLLACQGHYTGPEVAWADAARLGADIVEPNHPPRWANYLNQAHITLAQLFTHNLIWYNDPDTLLVGEPAPLPEARLATTVVALPGQLTFFGDKLGQLPAARMRLLQQTLPVCPVHPLDLVPMNELKAVWDLKVRRPFGAWDVVSLFNWGEAPREIGFRFAELGLDTNKAYLLYDFWNQQFRGVHRGEFSARIEPHANLLLAVHEQLDRPQFLATDRHVSQGGVECNGEEWHPGEHELRCTFKLVANDPLTAVIYCPPPHRFLQARAEGATIESVSTAPVISVVLRRPDTGEAKLLLSFGRETDHQ